MRITLGFLFLFSLTPLIGQSNFSTFDENGKVGLKENISSRVVYTAEFNEIGWSKGAFSIQNETVGLKQNEKWALGSTDGHKITRHYYSELYPFTGNLFIVAKRSNFSILNEYGVINNKGNEVIPITYNWVTPVGNVLIVAKKSGGESLFGLLNQAGKNILPLQFQNIEQLDSHTLSVQNQEGLYALYTTQGKALSPFLYEMILRYDENSFLVKYYNKEGLISKNGETLIPPIYKKIDFRNGNARGLTFNKWTLFRPHEKPSTYFHDALCMVNDTLLAAQTNENAALLTKPEKYSFYLPNSHVKHSKNGFVTLEKSRLQGVVNSAGRLIIPFQFDSVQFFDKVIFAKSERRDGQNWVIYNFGGKKIGLQQYESITPKDGGFLAKRNSKFGLLDAEGFETSPFIFDQIHDFQNGLAVAHYQGNQGIIKPNGNWFITPYNDSLQIVGQRIYYQQGTDYGIYDLFETLLKRTSNEIMPLQNAFIEKTEDGMLPYDVNANPLTAQPFDTIYQIHKDLLVLSANDRFKLLKISTGETFSLDKMTQFVRGFGEDLISILAENEWGFVSSSGLLTIANRYQEAREFSEGLAAVKLNGNWGFIDKQDQIAIQPLYSEVESFINQLARVQKDEKYGLVNVNGGYVLNPIYDELKRKSQYILLKKDNLYGLANHQGALVRTPQFDSISTNDGIHFIVERQGKFGVVDIQGRDLVPIAFAAIQQFNDSFLTRENGSWQAINLKTN